MQKQLFDAKIQLSVANKLPSDHDKQGKKPRFLLHKGQELSYGKNLKDPESNFSEFYVRPPLCQLRKSHNSDEHSALFSLESASMQNHYLSHFGDSQQKKGEPSILGLKLEFIDLNRKDLKQEQLEAATFRFQLDPEQDSLYITNSSIKSHS